MKNRHFIFIALLLFAKITFPQTNGKQNVYIDCDDCDMDFIKRNIQFVNYVRDQEVANVYILVTDQGSGGGGRTYVFNFMGRGDNESIQYELEYASDANESFAERREEITEYIKAGLLPFIVKENHVDVSLTRKNESENTSDTISDDPWGYWVFEIGADTEIEKEKNKSGTEYDIELDVEKVTNEWRIRSEFEYDFDKEVVKTEDFSSSLETYEFSASGVKSLGPNWSAGAFTGIYSNPSRNTQIQARLQAAVEYNIFPYEFSNRKEFTIAYFVGPRKYNYVKETIFNKEEEFLWSESLAVHYRTIHTWGRIDVELEGYHYFHDFSKNRLSFESWASVRLIKGLFLRFGAEFNLIHDQLYLPKGDATLEEILLERTALQTNYEFELNAGFVYTFGSIYNNIVNTRL